MSNFKINPYPYNSDCAFALTIDDLHPEGVSDLSNKDFGLDFQGDFWSNMEKLHNLIPEIKPTIFTVPAWTDRPDFPGGIFWPLRKLYRSRRSYPAEQFDISDAKYAPWIKSLNSLKQKYNLEYAMHGLHHHNNSLDNAPSQEFLSNTDGDTVYDLTQQMIAFFSMSKLDFSKGFRAPGWGLFYDHIPELARAGVSYLACSANFTDPIMGKNISGAGLKNVSISLPEEVHGLLNFTSNCYADQADRMIQIAKYGGVIVAHAHIAKTVWGLKYVDDSFAKNLVRSIQEVKFQSAKKIWFATLEGISVFHKALKKVQIVDAGNSATIINDSDVDLKGLTVTLDNIPYIFDIDVGQSRKINKSDFQTLGPKVSVVLTVYNGQKSVEESLDSLAKQTHNNTELVVVNDGSTDSSLEIISNYISKSNDIRIKLINQPNLGRSKARNNGMKQCSGEIITFCEDDAFYSKDYILFGIRPFFSGKKLGGVIGPHYVWNKNASFNTRVKDLERRRNFHNYKPNSCWFYLTEKLRSMGGFNEDLELVEDIEPAIKLANEGYVFEYVADAIWLHREPANFYSYLRRKFRGGIGMAILKKMGLKRVIIPPIYFFALFSAILTMFYMIVVNPLLFLLVLIVLLYALLLLRYKSILLSRKLSTEFLTFICFGIYVEYIWWASTFFGYLTGMFMTLDGIKKYLKGR